MKLQVTIKKLSASATQMNRTGKCSMKQVKRAIVVSEGQDEEGLGKSGYIKLCSCCVQRVRSMDIVVISDLQISLLFSTLSNWLG